MVKNFDEILKKNIVFINSCSIIIIDKMKLLGETIENLIDEIDYKKLSNQYDGQAPPKY